MVDVTTTPYRVRSTDPEDLAFEVNRVFGLLSDRLDQIEGFRGKPRFYDVIEATTDVVIDSWDKGLVLKDNGDPPNYWRLTIDSAGTRTWTNLGASYE